MQFSIRSLLVIVTGVAVQLALCGLPEGYTTSVLATCVYLAIMSAAIAVVLASPEHMARNFCIGLLFPAAVWFFGNSQLVHDLVPVPPDADNPFGNSYNNSDPVIYSGLLLTGLGCGTVIVLVASLVSKNTEVKRDDTLKV